MDYSQLITQLQSDEAKTFLKNHAKDDTQKLRLRFHQKKDLLYAQLIDQIEARQRLKKKNADWVKNNQLVFPPKLNTEQSSSQSTAKYKASLLKGEAFIDITGGLGVDTAAFSKQFKKGHYCELSSYLCVLAKHNFSELELNIEVHNSDGFEVLKKIDHVDLVYIDPARRIEGKRMVSLKDCEPDVTQHIDLIFEKTTNLLIKTSPLLDITAVTKEIPFIKTVHVVSVNNECKELLFYCENGFSGNAKLLAINLIDHKTDLLEKEDSPEPTYSQPERYLYEPNASIMKAGLFRELAAKFNLKKLHPNSHLFTSEDLQTAFPGKVFEITNIHAPFRKSLKGEAFNIVVRNFNKKPDQIKKKLKLKDGGARFLFATTLNDEKKAFILCNKVG